MKQHIRFQVYLYIPQEEMPPSLPPFPWNSSLFTAHLKNLHHLHYNLPFNHHDENGIRLLLPLHQQQRHRHLPPHVRSRRDDARSRRPLLRHRLFLARREHQTRFAAERCCTGRVRGERGIFAWRGGQG